LVIWVLACSPEAEPPSITTPVPRPGGVVRIVAVSAATPLVTRLVRAFSSRNPGPPLVVEAPLGAAGAAAALADGAVDAVVVLRGAEEPPPDNGVRLARTQPCVVVGPAVPQRHIGAAELARRISDAQPRWRDGHPLRLLLRPGDDPLQRAVAGLHPDLAAAIEEAVGARRFRVVSRDAELREALRATPGAIGVTDVGGLRMHATPLWRMKLTEGRPAPVDLWLVTGDAPPPRLAPFVGFATGAQGRGLVVDLGYGAPP